MFKNIMILILALLLSSCASSKRMLKISPFNEGREFSEMPDKKRINSFPLLYHNADKTSLLWPFVDWDKDGFAVRPIYNKEKDEQSFLFPLVAWNKKNKNGWFLTAYWNNAFSY